MTPTAADVALAVVLSIRGLREGARVEEDLWPAVRSCGVSRRDFDAAIDSLIEERRVERSYDRIYARL